jgi:hypothetical protein
MTTPMLPPIGSAYYDTLRPHIIVVVVSHNVLTTKYGEVLYKRMDTGTEYVADRDNFVRYYSPLETMENK